MALSGTTPQRVRFLDVSGVADGVDGWSLESYSWDPETGQAVLDYERADETGEVQHAQHVVWHTRCYVPAHLRK